MRQTRNVTFASGNRHLDRAAHLREMAGDLLSHRQAVFAVVSGGKVLIDLSGSAPDLSWVSPNSIWREAATEPPVFLGRIDDAPRFAVNIPEQIADQMAAAAGGKFIDLRSIGGELAAGSATAAATARALIEWHRQHPYCARCAAPTILGDAGWKRVCADCGVESFPRTDPVVIMLIVSEDRALLGRQAIWPAGVYSLLAGFVEPGETIEDAVRRETLEEAGVQVGKVGYAGSQPWPFPGSLMIGCVGVAETDEIIVDREELEDARWVGRAAMPEILAGRDPQISPPLPDAIARAMLMDWAVGDLKP